MATIAVFDTETISTNEKKFCYNVGYVILDTDSRAVLCKKDFVVEQIWHNRPLFETAYYADKRPLYVSAMRGKRATLDKWGYIMREMMKDFREHKVEFAYAYNSPFDDSVFTFNCDWFKTSNPFDTVPVLDIRGMVSQFITNTADYIQFCEDNERFTEGGNYSATAETVYQYVMQNTDFVEEHTALADSEIELEILLHCIGLGSEWETDYKTYRSIPKHTLKEYEVIDAEGTSHKFPYTTKRKINGADGVRLTIQE